MGAVNDLDLGMDLTEMEASKLTMQHSLIDGLESELQLQEQQTSDGDGSASMMSGHLLPSIGSLSSIAEAADETALFDVQQQFDPFAVIDADSRKSSLVF